MERATNRIRQSADAHLQRGLVWHQSGNAFADGCILWPESSNRRFEQRRLVFDYPVDLGDMKKRIAKDAGHARIDLDDEALGRTCDRGTVVVVGAEGEVAVRVHRRDSDYERVNRYVLRENARS